MTLREALKTVDRQKVFRLINEKDQHNAAACDRPPMEQTVASYTHVIDELLSKRKGKPYKMPWFVKWNKDPISKERYIEVVFLNPNYVAPAKGLKPWGGKRPPPGHYNCNADKHNEFFAAGWTPWSKIIDAEIMYKGNFTLERLVAEILWEITFYGWTEKRVKNHVGEIKNRIEEATKEIKEGKYIEIPPRKKGGYKIVIPNVVSKQLKDIIGETEKTKCSICYGHGLWPDGTAPMGPMDASDGMPTIACPDCGKNANPTGK